MPHTDGQGGVGDAAAARVGRRRPTDRRGREQERWGGLAAVELPPRAFPSHWMGTWGHCTFLVFFLPQPCLLCSCQMADWDCWRVATVSSVGNDGALFHPPSGRVAGARALSDGRWSCRATTLRWVPHVAATCPAGGVRGGGLWCSAQRVRVCLRWWVPSFWPRAGLLRAPRRRRFRPFFSYPPVVPLLLWPCRHGRRFPSACPPLLKAGLGVGSGRVWASVRPRRA